MLSTLEKEVNAELSRTDENFRQLDNKISQITAVNTGLIVLFTSIIKLNELEGLATVGFSIGILGYIASLIVLIVAYTPRSSEAIDTFKLLAKFEKKGFKSEDELRKAILGGLAESTSQTKKHSSKKSKLLTWGIAICLSSTILLSIILTVK